RGSRRQHRVFQKLSAGQRIHKTFIEWIKKRCYRPDNFPAASALAFASTSLMETGDPPRRLLSSAASINVKISIVSSAATGDLPVLKNRAISWHSGSYALPPAFGGSAIDLLPYTIAPGPAAALRIPR